MSPGIDLDGNGTPDLPATCAKVRYDAYGKPTIYHPADMNRDGMIGRSGTSKYAGDLAALSEALDKAPFGAVANVDAQLRAWRALASIANISQLDDASDTEAEWDGKQVAWFQNAMNAGFDANITNDPQVITYKYAELFGNVPLYASYWWDSRIGLYHVRHRVYDPGHGRWLQRDPIGYAGGNNLYGYGPNAPHMGSDPMGLWWGWVESIAENVGSTVSGALHQAGEFIDIIVVKVFTGTGESTALQSVRTAQVQLDRDGQSSLGNADASAGEALGRLAGFRSFFGSSGDLMQHAVLDMAGGGGATGGVGGAKALASSIASMGSGDGSFAAIFLVAFRRDGKSGDVGTYVALRKALSGSGQQANHLNQVAAFRAWFTSTDAMLANALKGGVHIAGSEHYLFHASLETFWEVYRKSRSSPTVSQYFAALANALRATGRYTEEQIAELVQAATAEIVATGHCVSEYVPNVPGRLPIAK